METIPRKAVGVKEISFQDAFSQSQETLDESLFFMQRMVFFATSQILQLRELISQKAFQKRAFDDTVFYALDPDHPVGFELVQELEGPLKEIGRGALKKLMIVVRDLQADIDGDDSDESIVVHEVFSMQLTYGVNGSIVISRERDQHIMCEMIYSGPESVKRETANLIEQIAKLKQILAPLPSFVGFCFRIILNNDQSSFLNFRVVTRPLSLPVDASYKCVGGVVTGQAGMLLDVQSVYLRKEAMSRVHTPLRLGIQPTHHFTRSPSRTHGTATTMVEPRTMLMFGEDSEQMGAFDDGNDGMGLYRHYDGASSGFSVPSHPSPLSRCSALSHLSASSPHSNRTVDVVASGMDLHSQRQSTGSGFSSVESKKSNDKSNVSNTEEKKSDRRSTSTTTTTTLKKVDASSSARPITSKKVLQPEGSTKPAAKPASVKATITFERPDPGHQQAKKVDKFAKLLGERLNKLRVEKPREEVHDEERRLSIRGTHPTLLKFPTGTGRRLPVSPLSSPRTLSRQPVSPLSSPHTLSSEDKYSSSASSGTNMCDVSESGDGHQDGDTLQDIPSIDREEETKGLDQDEAGEREKSDADGGRQPPGDRSSLVVHAPSVRLRRQPRGMRVGEELAQPRVRVPIRGKAVIDVDPNYKESKVNVPSTVPSVQKHSSNESRLSRTTRREMVDAEKDGRESVEKVESEKNSCGGVLAPVSPQRSPSQIRYTFSPLSTVSSPPIPPSDTVTRAATSRSATFLETSVTTRKVVDTSSSSIDKGARKSVRGNVVEPLGEDNAETGDKTTSSDDTMMDVDSISMAVDSSAMEPSIEAPRDDSDGKKKRNDEGTDMRTSLEVHADTVRKRKMAKPMKPEQGEIAQPRRRVPMRGRAVIECDDGESERKKEREEKEVIPSAVRKLTPSPPPTTIHGHWARASPISKQVRLKDTVVDSGEPKRRRMARTGRIDQ